MEPSQVWQIIVLIILLVLSGFFSMSETALMALSKIRIRHMVEDGVKGAKLVEKLTEDPNKLLGAILIGNNIVNILASSLATTLFVSLVGPSGVGIATAVMTVLVLIFGEITPKSIKSEVKMFYDKFIDDHNVLKALAYYQLGEKEVYKKSLDLEEVKEVCKKWTK